MDWNDLKKKQNMIIAKGWRKAGKRQKTYEERLLEEQQARQNERQEQLERLQRRREERQHEDFLNYWKNSPYWGVGAAAPPPKQQKKMFPVMPPIRVQPFKQQKKIIPAGGAAAAAWGGGDAIKDSLQTENYKPIILIPQGTYFLRTNRPDNIVPRDRGTFYGFDYKEMQTYYKRKQPDEDIFLVKTTRNIYVLDMRFVSVFKTMLSHLDRSSELYMALRTTFFSGMDRIPIESLQRINRASDYHTDRIYTNYLCYRKTRNDLSRIFSLQSNVDGFLFPQFHDAATQGPFHFEIIVCEPASCMEVVLRGNDNIKTWLNQNPHKLYNIRGFRQITAPVQNYLKTLPFENDISVSEFINIYLNSDPIKNKIISRTSKFSIVMKSTLLYALNVYDANLSNFHKYSVITKIIKYTYQGDRRRFTKSNIDSFLLEFINGMCVNTYEAARNHFVKTYMLNLFAANDEKNQSTLFQIQKPGQFQFSSYVDTPDFAYTDFQTILNDPRTACNNYNIARYVTITQQCVENNMTFYAFLTSPSHSAKDKLLSIVRFSYKIFEVFNSLRAVQFSHNDLHLNNVLIDLDKDCTYNFHPHGSFTKKNTPIIIDYGRSSTQYSRDFLNAVERTGATAICNETRTNKFKNHINQSFDLMFLQNLRQNREFLQTTSQQSQELKNDFFALLNRVPPDSYFSEVNVMPLRITYDEWLSRKGLMKPPGAIASVYDAYEALRVLFVKHFRLLQS